MTRVPMPTAARTAPGQPAALVDDPAVRACARDALRRGASPTEVAATVEVCVEDLYDLLGLAAPL